MDVRFQWAWLLAEWSTKLVPLTGSMREIWGYRTTLCAECLTVTCTTSTQLPGTPLSIYLRA